MFIVTALKLYTEALMWKYSKNSPFSSISFRNINSKLTKVDIKLQMILSKMTNMYK